MPGFIPKKGDLFYRELLPFVEDETEVIANRTTKIVKKTTYYTPTSGVNRCLGTDDRCVVYEILSNPNNPDLEGEKRSAIKNREIFYPVGPEIKEALGLLESVDDSNPFIKESS
jgi:hypothetical protein